MGGELPGWAYFFRQMYCGQLTDRCIAISLSDFPSLIDREKEFRAANKQTVSYHGLPPLQRHAHAKKRKKKHTTAEIELETTTSIHPSIHLSDKMIKAH
mmetsp:Transcript_32239/g.93249  ORF Transcript_32239/g.93249 Transcript_32239/m.93249 type:complete len:99 (+) Transcript_32239:107-403(+)